MLVAQITDTHITQHGAQAGHLVEIVAWLNAAAERPDLVLITGDLANDGRPEEYALLRTLLARSSAAIFVVPGNHDRRRAIRTALPPQWYPGAVGETLCYVLDDRPVRLIGIDTTAPGRAGGVLCAQRLAWLDATLSAAPARPTLLFMHHPPFRTGVNLADMFGFPGAGAFRAIVGRHAQVRRIVSGHVHCERAALIGAAAATSSISSTPQLVPEFFERRPIGLRREPGGFTLHRFSAGTFSSRTYVRAGNARFTARS